MKFPDEVPEKKEEQVQKTNGQDKILVMKRWQNRRKMAYISLFSMIIVTVITLFTDVVDIERLKVLKEVITWFYFSCASIIGAYMGFTTYASIKRK